MVVVVVFTALVNISILFCMLPKHIRTPVVVQHNFFVHSYKTRLSITEFLNIIHLH